MIVRSLHTAQLALRWPLSSVLVFILRGWGRSRTVGKHVCVGAKKKPPQLQPVDFKLPMHICATVECRLKWTNTHPSTVHRTLVINGDRVFGCKGLFECLLSFACCTHKEAENGFNVLKFSCRHHHPTPADRNRTVMREFGKQTQTRLL